MGGMPRLRAEPEPAYTSNPAEVSAPTASLFGWQPPGEPRPDRRDKVLGHGDDAVGGPDVLVEPDLSARPEHAMHLGKSRSRIRKGAHHQGQHDGVAAGVLDRQHV
ncbi:MAG: hypothetical protein QOD68_172, partial [Actinomycetota bacterium]|nr:hypothetical protein [Actinomycetota bacterium]